MTDSDTLFTVSVEIEIDKAYFGGIKKKGVLRPGSVGEKNMPLTGHLPKSGSSPVY